MSESSRIASTCASGDLDHQAVTTDDAKKSNPQKRKRIFINEERDKAMEGARKEEKRKEDALTLERELHAVLDERTSKNNEGYRKQRFKRLEKQEDELDQKKLILEKIDREKEWKGDRSWHRRLERLKEKRNRAREDFQNDTCTQSGTMWEEKPAERWARSALRDSILVVCVGDVSDFEELARSRAAPASEADDFCPAMQTLSPRTAKNVMGRDVVGEAFLLGVVSDVTVDGEATCLAPRGRVRDAYLFYELNLKIRFEVALMDEKDFEGVTALPPTHQTTPQTNKATPQTSNEHKPPIFQQVHRLRRNAEEMIRAAAALNDGTGRAPMTFCEKGVLRGVLTINEFSSESDELDVDWELEPSEYGARVSKAARRVAGAMKTRILDVVCSFDDMFREEYISKRLREQHEKTASTTANTEAKTALPA